MAANSLREQIILNVISTLESVSSITTVSRTRPAFNGQEFIDLASANLPLAAVVGQLPDPDGKLSSGTPANYVFFTSQLGIGVTVYADATANPDLLISSLVDDVWVGLHEDLTRGGVALMTEVKPELETKLVHPYVLFDININVTYEHGIDSI